MRLRAFPLLIALAGCGADGTRLPTAPMPQYPAPEGAADTCGAAPFAHLIGQPATALERQLVMRPVRLLRADDASGAAIPSRLTFHIVTPADMPADTPPTLAERIAGVTCG